jgi:hypothetical protein
MIKGLMGNVIAHRCFQDMHIGGQQTLRPLQNRFRCTNPIWRIAKHYDTFWSKFIIFRATVHQGTRTQNELQWLISRQQE